MKAKDIRVGMKILADWSKDWRQHLQLPSIKEEFSVDAIDIDDELINFETKRKNKHFGFICFIQRDGSTIVLNPEEDVEIKQN